MSSKAETTGAELRLDDLLAHADWVRGLARRLVADEASADDLVQDAWMAALRNPPSEPRNLRAWLGRVVHNRAIGRARQEDRRSGREEYAAREEALPSALDVVAEANRSQDVAAEVLALDEPYRTVLLLRFWRDLSPKDIGRQLERPVGTVKTQLQRGLERLRVRLDRRYGERPAWVALLAPLASSPAPVAAAGLPSLALYGALAAAAVLFASVALHAFGSGGQSEEDVAAVAARSQAKSPVPSTRPSLEAAERRQPASEILLGATGSTSADASIESSSSARFPIRGRIVDLEGEPVPHLRIAWVDPEALRWTDEEETILSGEDVWLRVDPELREQLKGDPEQLEDFVAANLPNHGRSRALILGQELPRLEGTTADDGGFSFEVPSPRGQVEVMREDLGVVFHARNGVGDGNDLWFVAPTWSLSGRIVHSSGEQAVGASVRIASGVRRDRLPSTGSSNRSLWHSATTDEHGTFVLKNVPCGPRPIYEVRARGDDWRRATHGSIELANRAGPRRVDDLELMLTGDEEIVLTLSGQVLQDDGEPAPRALVMLRDAWAWTDPNGFYELELRRRELSGGAQRAGTNGTNAALVATRALAGIAILPDYADLLEGRRGTQTAPALVLPRRALQIEGVVVDANGEPIAGARFALLNPTQGTSLERSIEDVSAGAKLGDLRSDEDGRFRIGGLADRSYAILVRHESRPDSRLEVKAGARGVRVEMEENPRAP